MRSTIYPAALLLTLVLVGATRVRAQFVIPTGYSFSVAPNSNGDFYPDSGGELTDGVLGLSFDHYSVDTDAGAWTGWVNLSPTISFQFATTQTFSRIEVGTTRLDGAAIGALTSVTLAGTTFTSGITLANDTRDWLVFDDTFSTTLVGGIPTITLSLTTAFPSQWIMLDEVRFTSAIPEPAESGALLPLLAVGAIVVVRRQRGRAPSAR